MSIQDENWSSVQIEGKSYSIKSSFQSTGYEILLLDLAAFKLYHVKQDEDDILKLFKELNKALDAPFAKILGQLKESLLSRTDLNAKFENKVLSVQSKLAGFKFYWQYKFTELPQTAWKDHVVVPLLLNIAEYQSRESELVKLIQSKDKELDDYRAQGFKLTRKYLNTDTFSQEAFDEAIASKVEGLEYAKSPEKCLYSESFKVVNKSRASKLKRLESAEPKEPQPVSKLAKKTSSDEDTDASSTSGSQKKAQSESQETKKSRLAELQQMREEEAKRNEKKQKKQKKKLF